MTLQFTAVTAVWNVVRASNVIILSWNMCPHSVWVKLLHCSSWRWCHISGGVPSQRRINRQLYNHPLPHTWSPQPRLCHTGDQQRTWSQKFMHIHSQQQLDSCIFNSSLPRAPFNRFHDNNYRYTSVNQDVYMPYSGKRGSFLWNAADVKVMKPPRHSESHLRSRSNYAISIDK